MRSIITICISLLVLAGCTVSYSPTGTSTGAAETISIETFVGRAPLLPAQYPQAFSEELKDQFLRQTSLDLVKSNGDLQVSGSIIRYTSNPIATTGTEQTSQNRLTVTVQVKFVNKLDPSQNFDKTFTNFEDYEATTSLTQVQDVLFASITDQLSQNIIQASIGKW